MLGLHQRRFRFNVRYSRVFKSSNQLTQYCNICVVDQRFGIGCSGSFPSLTKTVGWIRNKNSYICTNVKWHEKDILNVEFGQIAPFEWHMISRKANWIRQFLERPVLFTSKEPQQPNTIGYFHEMLLTNT